jgi:NhaA family Na+:H+ antiporter
VPGLNVPSDRIARQLTKPVRPLQEFIATESAGGFVLMAAALVALLWANSVWSEAYFDLIHAHLVLDLGFYRVDESVHFWVNDGLMVIFFFLDGLEIKRELVLGELNSARRAIVPAAAALGGMLIPVAVFFAIAPGGPSSEGWGVPMATDIAFALGVAALAGPRISVGLKVLLLALAIFDDLGAIAVIALFYSEGINVWPLVFALGALVTVFVLGRLGVRELALYVALGVFAWAAFTKSGVHPTLVGVALGMLTPARSRWDAESTIVESREVLDSLEDEVRAGHSSAAAAGHRAETELRLRELGDRVVSPLDRLEHGLNPWVAFLIVPIFALANAGVDLRGDMLQMAIQGQLTWAIALGLLFGKPLGVIAGTWLVVRAGAQLPEGVRWTGMLAVGTVAGIGFTVALFVAELGYSDAALLTEAKVGIFIGSILAGLFGYLMLRRVEPGDSR